MLTILKIHVTIQNMKHFNSIYFRLMKKFIIFWFLFLLLSNFIHAGEIFSSDDTRIFFSGRIAMVTAENENGDNVLTDNSSRFRFDVHKILDEDIKIIATSEYAVMANASDGEELFKNRLGYVGVSGNFGRISLGRVWNAAYNVSSWTDFDEYYGNDTLGVYSYGNGDLKGAIRTTNSIKYENNDFYGFTIAMQYSGPLRKNTHIDVNIKNDIVIGGSTVPANDYSIGFNRNYSVAGSVIYNINKSIAVGYAYSFSDIVLKDPDVNTSFIDKYGNTTQHVVGFIYNQDRMRFASTFGYSENMVYVGYKNFSNETHFSYNYDKNPINHSIISVNTFYSVHDDFSVVDYAFITFTITKALSKDVYLYAEISQSFRKEDSIELSSINPQKEQLLLGFRFSW